MAVRQYIGARYTILVYENSLDPSSAEWQANVTYQPITLVTYNNSSYLSKKLVPASVGNPAANPEYWVITGNYNGQIATLQSEIDDIIDNMIAGINSDIGDINDAIDTINDTTIPAINNLITHPIWNKQIAVYGDSWTDPNIPYTTWCNVLESATGKAVHKAAVGGYKLADIAGLWDSYNADIYIIMGGINDCITRTPILTGLNALSGLITNMRNTNPNAEIYIVTPCSQLQPVNNVASEYKLPFEMYRQMMWHCAQIMQVRVISGLKSTNFTVRLDADGLHPTINDANLALVGEWILKGILRGGDSRDYMDEMTSPATNQYIIQDGAVTRFIWDGCTLDNYVDRAQPFVANFDSGYYASQQPVAAYYDGVSMHADMMCFMETLSSVITFTKRSLSVASGTMTTNRVMFEVWLASCK